VKIGFDHRARRRVLDEVQPHWGAVAALAAAALGAYSQQQAAKKQQAASAASDLAGKQAAGAQPQPFQSVASQFAKPAGYDPTQRVQDGLAQDNQQNEQRLRALQMGQPASSIFSQAGAAPQAQATPPQQPSYMAGTQVQPGTGSQGYNLGNVPQTTQGGGMGLGGYANLLGTAAQIGGSMRQPPPPPAGLPQGQAPNYTPTAMEQLRLLMQMRQQGAGRRYY
jgi:hypothetical protein